MICGLAVIGKVYVEALIIAYGDGRNGKSTLRHTHATLLIESGANVKNVQARLGHTNIQTTLQTYVHNTEKMGQQSVNLFEQITNAKTL